MTEEWKDIEGYEGLYQVSNMGRIKSLRYWGGKRTSVMSPYKRSDGYLVVGLSKNGRTTSKTIHRLVAQAFIPNPQELEMVNHKDEIRTNNCVDNLEWCSRSYNQVYSMNIHPERRKVFADNFLNDKGENSSPFIKRGIPHRHNIKVAQKDKNGILIRIFNNAAEAGFILNLKSNNITSTCKDNQSGRFKKKHSAYGYIWEYVNE